MSSAMENFSSLFDAYFDFKGEIFDPRHQIRSPLPSINPNQHLPSVQSFKKMPHWTALQYIWTWVVLRPKESTWLKIAKMNFEAAVDHILQLYVEFKNSTTNGTDTTVESPCDSQSYFRGGIRVVDELRENLYKLHELERSLQEISLTWVGLFRKIVQPTGIGIGPHRAYAMAVWFYETNNYVPENADILYNLDTAVGIGGGPMKMLNKLLGTKYTKAKAEAWLLNKQNLISVREIWSEVREKRGLPPMELTLPHLENLLCCMYKRAS